MFRINQIPVKESFDACAINLLTTNRAYGLLDSSTIFGMSCFWIAAWSSAFPYFTQDWMILDAVCELASSATRSPQSWIIWGTSSRFLSFGVLPWRSTSHKPVASWMTWKFFCLFAFLSFNTSFLSFLRKESTYIQKALGMQNKTRLCMCKYPL